MHVARGCVNGPGAVGPRHRPLRSMSQHKGLEAAHHSSSSPEARCKGSEAASAQCCRVSESLAGISDRAVYGETERDRETRTRRRDGETENADALSSRRLGECRAAVGLSRLAVLVQFDGCEALSVGRCALSSGTAGRIRSGAAVVSHWQTAHCVCCLIFLSSQ